MKLRNKKTGEIVDIADLDFTSDNFAIWLSTTKYSSLAELNEEWEDMPEEKWKYEEDYEEPKEYWYIDCDGEIYSIDRLIGYNSNKLKEIGNYFETEEEAEKAVEKLKAWKRLKDDGLKIRKYELNGGTDRNGCFTGDICLTLDISKPVYEDILQLLFGGEK